jgi:hypothetical protein
MARADHEFTRQLRADVASPGGMILVVGKGPARFYDLIADAVERWRANI